MNFTQLRWQDPKTSTYLSSPALVKLTNGTLLACHDYFGPGCPKNNEEEEHLTSLYRSDDNGISWRNVCHIANAYWSTLFVHRRSLYLLGVSQQYGSIVIRRSDDGGNTWTHPRDAGHGLLFRGGPYRTRPNYHTNTVPVLFSRGRIFRAFEEGTWEDGFRSFVISAEENADLLDAASWRMSNQVALDPAALGLDGLENPNWMEGNVVESPDGKLLNLLRLNILPFAEKAAVLELSEDGKRLTPGPGNPFIDMPGGAHKFVIRRDPQTGRYCTLANHNTLKNHPSQRNLLSLCHSEDLRHWQVAATILSDDSGLSADESAERVGFQYADWQFDGGDMIAVIRVAYDGAHSFHDSNRIVFHRIRDYKKLLSAGK